MIYHYFTTEAAAVAWLQELRELGLSGYVIEANDSFEVRSWR
jgi:hypothetical protein